MKITKLVNGNHLSFPKILNIELMDYCPLSCSYCFKDNNATHSLEKGYLFKLIDEAAENGIVTVLLSGGEPLLYPDLIKVVEKLKQKRICTYISTSGVGLNSHLLKELLYIGLDMLYISLNGSKKEINELSRDGYDEAIQAMKMCESAEIPYRINWVARNDNIKDLTALIRMAKERNAQGIDILSNKSSKNGVIASPLTSMDMNLLIDIYRKNKNFLVYQTCFVELKNKLLSDKNPQSILLQGCSAGIYAMSVFSDGSFSICPHIYTKNNYDSLLTFWNTDKDVMQYRMNIKNERCQGCGYYKLCLPCRLSPVTECLAYERRKGE